MAISYYGQWPVTRVLKEVFISSLVSWQRASQGQYGRSQSQYQSFLVCKYNPECNQPSRPASLLLYPSVAHGGPCLAELQRAPYITNVASMLARSAERTHDYLCLLLLSLLLLLPEPLTLGPTMCFNFGGGRWAGRTCTSILEAISASS